MTRNHEEQHEQAKFVQWCFEQGLEPYATAQSTYTSSWSAISQNKALGVRRGVPDLIIFIPASRSINNSAHLIFCEMKKVKGGYASKEQMEFLTLVSQVTGNIHGSVCRGFEEAKSFIQPLIKDKEIIPDNQLEQFIHNL